jgi:hypothetical protein
MPAGRKEGEVLKNAFSFLKNATSEKRVGRHSDSKKAQRLPYIYLCPSPWEHSNVRVLDIAVTSASISRESLCLQLINLSCRRQISTSALLKQTDQTNMVGFGQIMWSRPRLHIPIPLISSSVETTHSPTILTDLVELQCTMQHQMPHMSSPCSSTIAAIP